MTTPPRQAPEVGSCWRSVRHPGTTNIVTGGHWTDMYDERRWMVTSEVRYAHTDRVGYEQSPLADFINPQWRIQIDNTGEPI